MHAEESTCKSQEAYVKEVQQGPLYLPGVAVGLSMTSCAC